MNNIIYDPENFDFKEISKVRVGERWSTLGIIGHSGFSLNAGSDTLLASGHIKDGDLKVGDHVGLGNIRGRITKVYNSEVEGEEDLIHAIEVTSETKLLPKQFHGNSSEYGYQTDYAIVHTILLVKDIDMIDEAVNPVLDGGTSVSAVYHGSVVVYSQQTEDPTTWPNEAQIIKLLEDREA